jgi:bacterioferritin
MKGNAKVIKALNDLLADELTAINQYMVHSEMCDDWGYGKLHEKVEKRAIDEMKHPVQKRSRFGSGCYQDVQQRYQTLL